MRGHLDDDDRAAQAADSLGHLDSDGAAAQHKQALQDRFHAGDLAVCPDVIEFAQARNVRCDVFAGFLKNDQAHCADEQTLLAEA
jgi:hypothetical protein